MLAEAGREEARAAHAGGGRCSVFASASQSETCGTRTVQRCRWRAPRNARTGRCCRRAVCSERYVELPLLGCRRPPEAAREAVGRRARPQIARGAECGRQRRAVEGGVLGRRRRVQVGGGGALLLAPRLHGGARGGGAAPRGRVAAHGRREVLGGRVGRGEPRAEGLAPRRGPVGIDVPAAHARSAAMSVVRCAPNALGTVRVAPRRTARRRSPRGRGAARLRVASAAGA